jgi:hypothetical protein
VRLRLWVTLAKASVLSSSALVLVRFNCPLGARCGLVVNECELGRLALPHEWRLTEDFDCDAAQLIREVRIGGKVEINPDDIAARDARSGLLERFPVPLPQVFTRGELGVVLCPKLPTPNGGAFASALVRYIVAYKRKAAPAVAQQRVAKLEWRESDDAGSRTSFVGDHRDSVETARPGTRASWSPAL